MLGRHGVPPRETARALASPAMKGKGVGAARRPAHRRPGLEPQPASRSGPTSALTQCGQWAVFGYAFWIASYCQKSQVMHLMIGSAQLGAAATRWNRHPDQGAFEWEAEAIMYQEDESVSPCIDATLACYRACRGLGSTLPDIADESVAGLLAECSETCRLLADQLIVGGGGHTDELLNCATVCDRCAEACETAGSFEECAVVCRWCADACRDLAEREAD